MADAFKEKLPQNIKIIFLFYLTLEDLRLK
jgi:hypothetical protein